MSAPALAEPDPVEHQSDSGSGLANTTSSPSSTTNTTTNVDAIGDNDKSEGILAAFTKYGGALEKLECNTPTKSKQGSAVWQVVKRLPASERGTYPKKTHVCTAIKDDGTVCCTLLRLSKVKKQCMDDQSKPSNWQTSLANSHLGACHAVTTTAGKANSKRKQEEMDNKDERMFAQGMNSANKHTTVLGRYTLTLEERALTGQARWYIYSRAYISKREFEAHEFREMLCEQNGGRGVFLSQKQLKEWVRAEFRIFLTFLRYAVATKMEDAEGNPFAQAIHDGGTLANKCKYQACGLQFISEKADANLVVCIGLVKSPHNTDMDVANLFKDVCKERTGFEFSELCMAVVSDRAAKGVSNQLNIEEEVCEMHDTDKIGQSATGALTRSRNKTVVNPFLEGAVLVCCRTFTCDSVS